MAPVTEEQEKLQEMSEAIQALRASHEAFEEEKKSFGEMKVTSEKANEVISNLELEVKDLRAKIADPKLYKNISDEDEAKSIIRAAYFKSLRVGSDKMEQDEKDAIKHLELLEAVKSQPEAIKGLSEGTDTAGGYLVLDDYVNQMIRLVEEISPIQQNSTVKMTAGRAIIAPSEKNYLTARYDDELEAGTNSDPSWGREQIPVYKIRSHVFVSLEELEDSLFDLESELRRQFSIKFSQRANQAFLNGNSIKKPEGILFNTSVANFNSGDANLIKPDSLLKLPYQLKTDYKTQGNPKYYANRFTISEMRVLKDTQLRYLWEPGLNGGQSAQFGGWDLVETPDMPNIAAGTTPIFFGSLNIAYWIAQRTQMTVTRNPWIKEDTDEIRFTARMRHGGQVVQPEAIVKYRIGV